MSKAWQTDSMPDVRIDTRHLLKGFGNARHLFALHYGILGRIGINARVLLSSFHGVQVWGNARTHLWQDSGLKDSSSELGARFSLPWPRPGCTFGVQGFGGIVTFTLGRRLPAQAAFTQASFWLGAKSLDTLSRQETGVRRGVSNCRY